MGPSALICCAIATDGDASVADAIAADDTAAEGLSVEGLSTSSSSTTTTTTTTQAPTTTTTPTGGDDPVFLGGDGQIYSVHGSAGAVFNILSAQGLNVNSKFVQVPQEFRTEDITDNVLGTVGVKFCSGKALTVDRSGSVDLDGKQLAAGEHKLGPETMVTVKDHFCLSADMTNCQWTTKAAPTGAVMTGHRQIVVQHGSTEFSVIVNFLMDEGSEVFHFMEVTIQKIQEPAHGLLGQNAFQASTTKHQVEVGVFGKTVSPQGYQGGLQGEGMIAGVWTDYQELDGNLHGSNFGFNEMKC